MKIEKSVCLNCKSVQADLDGICCKCGWNHREQRQSSKEEMKPVQDKLSEAIRKMKRILNDE